MKKRIIFLCLVMLTMLPQIVAAQTDSIYLQNMPEGSGVPVYAKESVTSDLLGLYNSSVIMKSDGHNENWYHVMIGVEPSIVIGYLPSAYVSSEWIAHSEQPIFWEVTSQQEASVKALERPDNNAKVLGYYSPGTILEILGDCGEYYHVQMGVSSEPGTTPFVHKSAVSQTNRPFTRLTGVEAIGFAEVNTKLKSDDPLSNHLLAYPDMSSEYFIEKGTLTNISGRLFELIAVMGDWCQVRSATDTTLSFYPRKYLDTYLYADLSSDEKPSSYRLTNNELMEDGTYLVGVDLPGGYAKEYTIRQNNPDKPSSYTTDTLGGYGQKNDPRQSVAAEDTILLFNGMLLEMENCILTLHE